MNHQHDVIEGTKFLVFRIWPLYEIMMIFRYGDPITSGII